MRRHRTGLVFPLVLVLGTAAAPAPDAPTLPDMQDSAPTTPPPAALLATTDAMRSACRAWIPQVPAHAARPRPALAGTTAARQQFDTCEMVLHTEKAGRMFMFLTFGSLWGGLMTLVVLFFVTRAVWRGISRKVRATP